MKQQISYKHSVVNYYVWGNGEKLLFCLHGYGETAMSFQLLEGALEETYTMIGVDLPFHGDTQWNEGLDCSPEDLTAIINSICIQLNKTADEKLTLLGYSMGGRLCLAMLQEIPQRIERLVLLAPDGLYKNKWYWFATQTSIGKRVFYNAVKNPGWLFAVMKTGETMGLLGKSISRITHYYLDQEHERLLLYKRWMTFRKLRPVIAILKKLIAANHIPVSLLFGAYDQLILSKRGRNLRNGLETFVHHHTIEAGHQLLKEKYVKTIASLFYE